MSLTLRLHCKCRRCDHCRAKRAAHWRIRALSETRDAVRTWFGTITFRPEAHGHMLTRARVRLDRQGIDLESLDYGSRFKEHERECGSELTKYLKRVRDVAGYGTFRHLLVVESVDNHQSGWPHYHALLHEVKPGSPLKHKLLSEEWRLGFTNFKLVEDERQATYLCKYLSKNACARVRASLRYGKTRSQSIVIQNNHV